MKLLFTLALFTLILITCSFSAFGSLDSVVEKFPTEKTEIIKEQVFMILQNKCNVCHRKKNKRAVFTLQNMDAYRSKIDKQVFKWHRMPKGNDIQLTPEEYQQLKTWVLTPN